MFTDADTMSACQFIVPVKNRPLPRGQGRSRTTCGRASLLWRSRAAPRPLSGWDAVKVKHGYTNRTELEGNTVRKTYDGPDSQERQVREHRALAALQDQFPVPRIAGTGPGWLSTQHVPSLHGQDLIREGHAKRSSPSVDALFTGCTRWTRDFSTRPRRAPW